MYELNEGDAVTRKSYNNDIIFEIKKIFYLNGESIAVLQGVTIRIEADSPLSDLQLIKKENAEKRFCDNIFEYRYPRLLYAGKILHLDGECIILEKIEENAYQAYPIAYLSILKLSCINGKNLHFYKKHDNIITKNI